LAAHGLTLPEEYAVDVLGGDRLDGRAVAKLILERGSVRQLPTAWICLNSLMARGAINYLTQRGWRIPQQISVVAVDATRVCVEEHPEITGASGDPEKMGAKAAELILQKFNPAEESLVDVILPAHLTVRETSGPAAVKTIPPGKIT
jgi:LacI family transcriptional regulator